MPLFVVDVHYADGRVGSIMCYATTPEVAALETQKRLWDTDNPVNNTFVGSVSEVKNEG